MQGQGIYPQIGGGDAQARDGGDEGVDQHARRDVRQLGLQREQLRGLRSQVPVKRCGDVIVWWSVYGQKIMIMVRVNVMDYDVHQHIYLTIFDSSFIYTVLFKKNTKN